MDSKGGSTGIHGVKQVLYHALAGVGYHVERLRDPYLDAARLAGGRDIDVAVDGGAYRGAATRKLLAVCPAAKILCFEPMPQFAAQLREHFQRESRIEVLECALSDRAGLARFHVHSTPFTSSLHDIGSAAPEMHVERDLEVKTVLLDDELDRLQAKSVLVKLDLQGHECVALRGMSRALADGRIKAVITEVNFTRRYHGGSTFADLVAMLADRGLYLHRLYDMRLAPSDGYELSDAVFARRSD